MFAVLSLVLVITTSIYTVIVWRGFGNGLREGLDRKAQNDRLKKKGGLEGAGQQGGRLVHFLLANTPSKTVTDCRVCVFCTQVSSRPDTHETHVDRVAFVSSVLFLVPSLRCLSPTLSLSRSLRAPLSVPLCPYLYRPALPRF